MLALIETKSSRSCSDRRRLSSANSALLTHPSPHTSALYIPPTKTQPTQSHRDSLELEFRHPPCWLIPNIGIETPPTDKMKPGVDVLLRPTLLAEMSREEQLEVGIRTAAQG